MTVTNTVSKQSYVSTGSTTVWPFSFPLDRDSDLALIVTAADGTEATVDPARYRLDRAAGTPGGSVTYPLSGPALAAGQTVTVLRRLPVTQATSLVTGAAFYAEDLERALDRLTMIDQQQQEQLDRTLKQPVSDPAGVALTLPPVAQRAGKSLKFDGSGALVATRFDPDAQQAAAAASAAAAAVSATAADADRVLAEAAAATAVSARETAVVSAAAAAAAAAAIGQETVEAVTADRAAVLADNGKVFAVNAAAGPVAITLPPIATVGEPFRLTVKKTDNTANAVSVVASGTDTLDGGTAPLRLRVQQGGARLDSDIDPSPDNWVSQSFGLAVGDATPVGAEMWFPGTTPPPGWLAETGALLSRAVYPDLWAFAQSSGMLVTEAQWQGASAEQVKFSGGDDSTTFRLPLRTVDAAGRRALIKAFSVPVDSKSIDVTALAAQVAATRRRLLTVTNPLVLPLPAGYFKFMISLKDILVSTSGAALWLQVSTDGGATWAASNYKYLRAGMTTASASFGGESAQAAGAGVLLSGLGVWGNKYGAEAEITVSLPAGGGLLYRHSVTGFDTAGQNAFNTGSGGWDGGAVNAVRIIASSGTLTGTAVLYGEP